MKYIFFISALTVNVCVYPEHRGNSLKIQEALLLAQEPDFYMTFFLCLFFTVVGCKFSLTNEHLEYIRGLIISFLLNYPYNFYFILPVFFNRNHLCPNLLN